MTAFINEINSISDIEILITLKEKIKSQAMDGNLSWKSREKLYKQVQLINEVIEEITQYR